MKEVLISNKKDFAKKIEALKKGGAGDLHILTDFDKTLTKLMVNGKKVNSLMSVLRESDLMPQEYKEKAQELFNYYHPLEADYLISREEKKKLMIDWWEKALQLMIDFKFNKNHLEKIIEFRQAQFRDNIENFLTILKENKVPLVIISASGVGEAIRVIFEKNNLLFENIFIVANAFIWQDNGYAIEPKKPIIHTINKDEVLLKNFPQIFSEIENRKNVILLGDNIKDIDMVEGFDFKNLIKIGFLNQETEKNLPCYQKEFDAVILNDGKMDFVNQLLKDIFS